MNRAERRAAMEGAVVGALLFLSATSSFAADDDPDVRRILVLQSMDRGNLAFDTFTADFRAALLRHRGARVTLSDFVVAPAGFPAVPEQPVNDFLRSAYGAGRQPELIVTIGAPAAQFARRNRSRLFPLTPVVFAAVDQRALGDAPLAADEASVTVNADDTLLLDDILRLLPETHAVFRVHGAGPFHEIWQPTVQKTFARYRGRLTLIPSGNLTYQQVLERSATLPPHTVIVYDLAGTFAAGNWQGDERTLADLAAHANAPIFGDQGVWLGKGIVGGRLLDLEGLGATTAEVVVRILDGEPPSAFRTAPRTKDLVAFDARQLRRWGIPEDRLPEGSTVRFREPSLWQQHRRAVLLGTTVVLVQLLLIAGLLYQRRARRSAELAYMRNLALAADADRRLTTSALTSSIAHELSQPLGAILYDTQAAELMLAAGEPALDDLREIVADIRTADAQAAEIVHRHRAMLRHHEVEAEPIDFHSVVRAALTLVANHAHRHRIRVDLDVATEPCTVVGDPVLLQQVVVNLMTNAIDAMADTPPESRRIAVSEVVAPEQVQLSIRDSGPGLPPTLLGQLFQPFVTTKPNGLGIGLAIVRTIVDAHGGTVEAHDNEGGGATFTVSLPRSGAAGGRTLRIDASLPAAATSAAPVPVA